MQSVGRASGAVVLSLLRQGLLLIPLLKHHLPVLAKCPIDPQLAALSDAGMIETYGGQFLEGAADACEKLLK